MPVNPSHHNLEPGPQGFKASEGTVPHELYPKMASALGVEPQELEDFDLQGEDAFNRWLDERLELLADDLLIGKDTLFQLKEEALSPLNEEKLEEFCNFLEKKQKKYGHDGEFRHIMEEARNQYKKLTGRPSIDGVSEHTVKKAYRFALKNLNKTETANLEGGTSFQFDSDKSQKVKEKFKAQHFLTAVNGDKHEIIAWSGRANTAEHTADVVNDDGLSQEVERPKDPAHLGAGTFGVAQKVLDFTSGEILAIKIAFPKKGSRETKERAYTDIRRENEVITDLNDGYQGRGLQKNYYYVFDFMTEIDGRSFQLVGVLGPLYNIGDLEALCKLSAEESPGVNDLKDMLLQLFEGGQRIHDKGYIHGDIKGDNIFFNRNLIAREDGWGGHISDFGGAKKIQDLINSVTEENPFGSNFSPGNFTFVDIEKSKEAFDNMKESKAEDKEANEKRWIELQQKRDVFALASAAWYLLSGDHPYKCTEKVSVGTYQVILPMTWEGEGLYEKDVNSMRNRFGNEITDTLIKALEQDPDERPSFDEVVKVLKPLIHPSSKQKNNTSSRR